jgi:DNA polymerase-3 subunit beta
MKACAMQFNIDKSVFEQALSKSARIINKRLTVPVLANSHLEARNGMVTLRSTDLDRELILLLDADVQEEGETIVDAAIAASVASKIQSGSVISFSLKESTITLRAGKSRFRLQTIDPSEFPKPMADEEYVTFDIDTHDVQHLFGFTKSAIAREGVRYYLNGVYFCRIDGFIRTVSTDGHRLMQAQVRDDMDGSPQFSGVIIPREVVDDIVTMAAANGKLRFSISRSKIKIERENIMLTSKLIDGTYPDYERVIPTSNDLHLEIDRVNLMKATERVASVLGDKIKAVKLSLSQGKLELSARSEKGDDAQEALNVDFMSEMAISLNPKYLIEALSAFDCETMNISFKDYSSQILLKAANCGLSNIGVIMPTRG